MSGRKISRIQQLISFYEAGSREDEDEDGQSSLGGDIIDSKGTVIPWLENQETCQDGKWFSRAPNDYNQFMKEQNYLTYKNESLL